MRRSDFPGDVLTVATFEHPNIGLAILDQSPRPAVAPDSPDLSRGSTFSRAGLSKGLEGCINLFKDLTKSYEVLKTLVAFFF